MITILLIILWYLVGVTSFIYWWTNTNDLTTFDFVVSLLMGLIGPIAFFLGWTIHGDSTEHRILIKKRKK